MMCQRFIVFDIESIKVKYLTFSFDINERFVVCFNKMGFISYRAVNARLAVSTTRMRFLRV